MGGEMRFSWRVVIAVSFFFVKWAKLPRLIFMESMIESSYDAGEAKENASEDITELQERSQLCNVARILSILDLVSGVSGDL